MPSDHSDDATAKSKRVLVAALNWGLGHASRCIPIIRKLEQMGATVILASDGEALHLLKAEFPHLTTVRLPSYNIRYYAQNMVLNIARQLPRMLYAIRAEQWYTERLVQQYHIKGVISDNRFGCFSKKAPSVLLSHQLNLRISPKSLEWLANQVLRRAFSKFKAIWVPDTPHPPTLSGALSHPPITDQDTHYIGVLSRVNREDTRKEPEYDVAVLLSGPEPQRSNLEQLLLEQAMLLPEKFIFVQGKTQSKVHQFESENIEVVSYLTGKELDAVINSSRMVVCRSGYSSLMDLTTIGKPALMIPTPGQTEQEYLADIHANNKQFLFREQGDLDLAAAIEILNSRPPLKTPEIPQAQFEPTLRTWYEQLP